MTLALLVLVLGFAVSCLSGLLGIGGGIVMAPALLYLPRILGVGALDMRQVTGLTITQGLFACLSGAFRHDRDGCVDRRLVRWMGFSIACSALAGSILSTWVSNEALMALFAALAVAAAILMLFPREVGEEIGTVAAREFPVPLAVLIALVVGLLGGMVGQGGSFILIPLMLHLLKLPTRIVIGSNLALVVFSSAAGFAGKMATGQIPVLLGAVLLVGALPGAQVGSVLSQRTSPRRLRIALAVVVALSALGMATDLLAHV